MQRCQNHHIIAPEGYPIIAPFIFMNILGFFIHPYLGYAWIPLSIFAIAFFRNPKRVVPQEDNIILCPADGTVVDIAEVDENRFLNKRVRKISIFMSPFNVHVNRAPVDGKVVNVSYNKGKFLPAYAEKASLDNEQNAVVIQTKSGEQVLFIQIAGWLARRIVSYAKKEMFLVKGEIYGLIRFGSRMDVYCDLNYSIQVQLKQKVVAGETILGKK